MPNFRGNINCHIRNLRNYVNVSKGPTKPKLLVRTTAHRGAKKLAAQKRAQVTRFLCRNENNRLLPGEKKTQ